MSCLNYLWCKMFKPVWFLIFLCILQHTQKQRTLKIKLVGIISTHNKLKLQRKNLLMLGINSQSKVNLQDFKVTVVICQTISIEKLGTSKLKKLFKVIRSSFCPCSPQKPGSYVAMHLHHHLCFCLQPYSHVSTIFMPKFKL